MDALVGANLRFVVSIAKRYQGRAVPRVDPRSALALRERESRILRLYFGLDGEEPMTLEQIGSVFGITRERVRQIRDRSLRKLRPRMKHLAAAN